MTNLFVLAIIVTGGLTLAWAMIRFIEYPARRDW